MVAYWVSLGTLHQVMVGIGVLIIMAAILFPRRKGKQEPPPSELEALRSARLTHDRDLLLMPHERKALTKVKKQMSKDAANDGWLQ